MKIYKQLTNEQYHNFGTDYISSSFVKSVAKHSISKALEPLEPTQALMFGHAFHTYMESIPQFEKRFVVFDDTEILEKIKSERPDISVPSMTRDYKKYKTEFESNIKEGQTIISLEDMNTIEAMYASTITNKALQYVHQNYAESVKWDEYSFFTDEEDIYGLKYRVRPDRLLVGQMDGKKLSSQEGSHKRLCILDWKSCQNASVKNFRADFWRHRYDLQSAFYCMVLGIPMSDFYYVAIEKNYPYNCCVYAIGEETQLSASKELSEVLFRIGEWKKNPSTPQGLPNQHEVTEL